jgi:hypothetical protein
MKVIISNGGGWDHVSVSLENRCPTWKEMCAVKDLFFKDDEVAMQLHVAKADHINHHPFCLHLWRPQTPEERAENEKVNNDDGAGWPTPWGIPLPPKEAIA